MDQLPPDPEIDALVKELNAAGRAAGARADDESQAEDEASGERPGAASAGGQSLAAAPRAQELRAAWTLPRARVEGGERLDAMLSEARRKGASDLLLAVGARPMIRVDGALRALEGVALPAATLTQLAAAALPAERREELALAGSADVAFTRPGLGRFRANVHRSRGAWAVALRLLPDEAPSIESLDLPAELAELSQLRHGLVVVAGPTGSGKTSTAVALLARTIAERAAHVISIEDPIEFELGNGEGLVEQVEVGRDARSFAEALRAALRQDPDVIFVGEMRDAASIAIALSAAETGHLVISTMHTTGGAHTIHRILDGYAQVQAEALRSQLASSLEAIVSQQLVPRSDGPGRVPVVELLRVNDAVRNLLRRGQVEQLAAQVELGGQPGMRSFERSLADLVRAGMIEREDARRLARHPGELDLLLR